MNKMSFLFLCLLLHSICFAQTESAPPLMKTGVDIQMEYEPCTCTNNSYTHHLTAPYLPEIETWLFQTQEYITSSSRQFICPSCEEEEMNTGIIENITDTLNIWYEVTQDTIDLLFNDDKDEASYKKIIHPICFQMGRKFIDEQGSNEQFFSCIHDHYDGSEKGLCRAVSDQPFSPKQCMAIPISCQDVNNEDLSCPDELKHRSDYFSKINACNKGASYPRRPCFNQLYTAMTMKAFYDVSQCLEVDEHLAFSIFFHESRFVINIKSRTGALCYGQVTGNAAADFNLLMAGHLYPGLKPFTEPHRCPKVWEHFQKIETTKSVTRYILRSAQDQCRLSLNPYTCFFYGMGYLKILTYYAERAVSQTNRAGYTERNGEQFIFWDLPQSTAETQSSEIEEIKIFKDVNTLTRMLVILSYNGGPSISNYFKQYMEALKKSLRNDSALRQTLFEEGLSSDYFKNTFVEFLKQNYTPINRRTEAAQFLDKVNQDLSELNRLIAIQHPELQQDICPVPL